MKLKIYTDLKYWLSYLAVFLLFIACAKDIEMDVPVVNHSGEAMVRVSVSTPGNSMPRMLQRSTDLESTIQDIKALVFERENNVFEYRYMANGKRLTTDPMGGSTSFDLSVKSSSHDLKFLLIANADELFPENSPAPGTALDEVKENLVLDFNDFFTRPLPMHAEFTLTGGIDGETVMNQSAIMLRSVARIDILNEAVPGTTDVNLSESFEMQEIYIYRANDKLQIVPDEANMVATGNPGVKASSVPLSSNHFEAGLRVTDFMGGAQLKEKIYLPESLPETSGSNPHLRTTCIVVGGYYGNDKSTMRYYRIDFDSDMDGHPFGQVLRNYKYVFRIKKVLSGGYFSPDEAANSLSANIVATIEPWADFTKEMYFSGDNYLGVSGRYVSMRSWQNNEKTIGVQSSLQYSIQWLGADGKPEGSSVSEVNRPLENDRFRAQIVKNNDEQADRSHVRFTTLHANDGAESKRILRISAANWYFDVDVLQDSYDRYADQFITVLSITEFGDLGGIVESATNGLAMRKILTHSDNFSPTGTIPIGGFLFTRIDPAYSTAVSGDYLQGFKTHLYSSDVFFLTNNNRLSEEGAKVVMEWLKSKPTRILILGGDSQSTSMSFFKNYLNSRVDWWYFCNLLGGHNYDNLGEAAVMRNGYARAELTQENKPFLVGAFGEVSESAAIDRVDQYAGYAKSYAEGIIPLVVLKNHPDYMTMGIDKEKRIIYTGDSGDFHKYRSGYNLLPSNTGEITNDLGRLQANVWAWIVEQVLWEKN